MNQFLPFMGALLSAALATAASAAQPAPAAPAVLSPAVLPGNGLRQHSFVYAGEWDTRKPEAQSLFVVREGKIAWSTTIPLHTPTGGAQEFDDAMMLPNGNILFARMSGAGEITPDKKLVWDYPAPPGTEIHSIQSIGKNLVLMARDGNPAFAMIINTSSGQVVKQIQIPVKTTNTHGQYRHIRMTRNHTILIPLLSEDRVAEFTLDGREVWSIPAKSPWSAERLQNGNTLIAGDWSSYVREVNPAGATVWELTQADVPEYRLFNTQTARRLANGNTIICNWVAGDKNLEDWPNTVQLLEVTPSKKVVWALRSWKDPADLGPATHIHLLDEQDMAETVDFVP